MIILDTNVISELFRPVPHRSVLDWIESQPGGDVFSTTITRGELLYGIRRMPMGRKRTGLLEGLTRLFNGRLAGRLLAYDNRAADEYAAIAVDRRSAGRPMSQSDAMIAGIVRTRGAVLATRNGRDFDGCGIDLIDPWR